MSAIDALSDLLPATALAEDGAPSGLAQPGWLGRRPDSVVRPGSVAEVAAVMEWASAEGVGVLPCGTGWWAAPVDGDGAFVALSSARLAGIETYEPADLTLTAGAGTPFAEVDQAFRAHRQWAPFDPPFADRRSLGGLVAEGTSGPLRTGYGELRNHVLGMTVVTGDGRTLRLGGGVVKNVAGYDLLKAMVGSRGRLGVITSVCLRAFPEPAVDLVLTSTADSVAALLPVAHAVATAPVLPVSIVIADPTPALDGRAALVVRLHGAASTVVADRRTIETHVGRAFEEVSGATRDALASELRDGGGDAPALLWLSVRPSRLSEMTSTIERLEGGVVTIDAYGGLVRIGGEAFEAEAVGALEKRVASFGGALRVERWPAPGERPRRSGSEDDRSSPALSLTRRLEEAFDPRGVLWPCRR